MATTRRSPMPTQAALTYLKSLTDADLRILADDAASIQHDLCVEARDLAQRLEVVIDRQCVQERLISAVTDILAERGAFADDESSCFACDDGPCSRPDEHK